MRKKILKVICTSSLAIVSLVVVFLLVQIFSIPLALSLGGFNTEIRYELAPTGTIRYDSAQFAHSTLEQGGYHFTAFYTTTKDGKHALISLQKNPLGIWYITQAVILTDDQKYVSISWLEEGNIGYTFLSDRTSQKATISEENVVIMGNNAIADIDATLMKYEQQLQNYYYKVYQNGSFYVVYEIGQRDSHPEYVYNTLVNSGCVPAS